MALPFKHKNEVFDKLLEFKTIVENILHSSIKIFQSNNGMEFVDDKFSTICSQNGIIHRFSCLIILNKMASPRGSISTYLILLEVCYFKPACLLASGVMPFKLLFFLWTELLLLLWKGDHYTKFCIVVLFLTYNLLEFLDFCIIPMYRTLQLTSSLPNHFLVSSWESLINIKIFAVFIQELVKFLFLPMILLLKIFLFIRLSKSFSSPFSTISNF